MRFSLPGVLPSSGASTSQQWRQPMPMTCERNLCPTGEGRDGTGPSSRYGGRVFQPLLHCAQEKRWVTTNLGSAHLDAQDAHAEPRLRMHPSPSSVCSIDLKTRTSMCRSFRATGHSCGLRSKDEHISTGPALRAVPIAPCLHESSGGSPCSLERTGRAHSQLPRRLAHTGSVSGSVMRTQGLVLSHLSQLGLRVNWEKSKLLLMQRISFLGMEFGFGQSDSAPHAGTRSVGVELLEYVQEQAAAPLKQVSKAPGACGGFSGGHTAGAAPYETASTLAPWPSPEVGVAERHAAGPSHSSLPPNLHPVVRPFIPSGRSAPGTGLQAHCGLHGCLHQCLHHVQRACSVGGLDGSPTALAYQLPRVAGSTPGLEPSQETLTRRARTGPYGQHCDRCVHQPTRWTTLPSHVASRPPPPPLESEASEVASRHSYSGLAQPDRPTSCHELRSPENGDSIPRRSSWFATFWTRTGRPVRVPRDVALPVVLLPDRGNTRHGRTGTQLAFAGLCKYAFPPVSLLAQTLCKVREEEEQILLMAPYWPTRTWFLELMLLVTAPPWQIPLRKDLLTQRRGTLWHPHPDLWKLHVWSLDGTRRF